MRTDPNFFYITGYTSGIFENSQCYLFRDGHVEVITSPLEEQAARQKEYEVHIINSTEQNSLARTVEKITKDENKIGLNCSGISYSDYLSFTNLVDRKKIVDVSEGIDYARRIK